jgi:hypothetical protein
MIRRRHPVENQPDIFLAGDIQSARRKGYSEAMASWQIKRDGTRRGIVEVKEAKP